MKASDFAAKRANAKTISNKTISETVLRHFSVNGNKCRISLLRASGPKGAMVATVTVVGPTLPVSRFLCPTEQTAHSLGDVLRSALRQDFSRNRLHHIAKVYLEPYHSKGYDGAASPRMDELTAMAE